jgi:hydrogenase maturation protease
MIPCLEFADVEVRPAGVMVLGIGNTLLGDEGAGVHALRQLEESGDGVDGVRFVDGGTMGLTLAGLIEPDDALIVLDAARLARSPGSVAVFEGSAMDAFLGSARERSVHEVGLLDVMGLAALAGRLPLRRALIGIQPHAIDWSSSPSEAVARALPRACRRARALIARWRR